MYSKCKAAEWSLPVQLPRAQTEAAGVMDDLQWADFHTFMLFIEQKKWGTEPVLMPFCYLLYDTWYDVYIIYIY